MFYQHIQHFANAVIPGIFFVMNICSGDLYKFPIALQQSLLHCDNNILRAQSFHPSSKRPDEILQYKIFRQALTNEKLYKPIYRDQEANR
jgi:hypothetical protein